MERGFWGGFTAGVGAVLADGLLATLTAFGVTAISGIIATYQQELQLIGGIVLIAFAVKLFTVEPKLAKKRNGTSLSELRRIVDWVPEGLRPALRFLQWFGLV
ncbi:MAG: LysE family transporter [Alphaproteobacteria bacterium]